MQKLTPLSLFLSLSTESGSHLHALPLSALDQENKKERKKEQDLFFDIKSWNRGGVKG
jgi:hypothetical protein